MSWIIRYKGESGPWKQEDSGSIMECVAWVKERLGYSSCVRVEIREASRRRFFKRR